MPAEPARYRGTVPPQLFQQARLFSKSRRDTGEAVRLLRRCAYARPGRQNNITGDTFGRDQQGRQAHRHGLKYLRWNDFAENNGIAEMNQRHVAHAPDTRHFFARLGGNELHII